MIPQQNVRNFCIVAHIDHGKSTLADRLLEYCGAVNERGMVDQMLDTMDLERERGITIKASAVRLQYTARDGELYALNLIDTPGHVDFSYEVSRALHACEGAVVLVDTSQGVEAQTVANIYLALDAGLDLVPVVNKIDLENFDPERAVEELQADFGFRADEVLFTSGKTGKGVDELLEAVVTRVGAPTGDAATPLRALVFDSEFDPHRGVIAYVRVFDGTVKAGDRVRMMSGAKEFDVSGVGTFQPGMTATDELRAGDVGYLTAGIKGVKDCQVGDTITDARHPAPEPLAGYREPKPMVFCGLYPTDSADYEALKDALDKFSLNDAAFHYEPETSAALGFGFRCGFLGLLHMDIVQERLEREYNLELVATAPSVKYQIYLRGGELVEVDNPAHFPDAVRLDHIEEPIARVAITAPQSYVGACMKLSEGYRGEYQGMEYMYGDRVVLNYRLPLAEIIVDYFDKLKSVSRGYASMDYELAGYSTSDLVKVDVMINGDPVDALAVISHRTFAEVRARKVVTRLKASIPKQMFEVRIQAAIGSRVISSARQAPLRKNVTEKCYGGDITRKRKLLEKQKEGKKRMKQIGHVEVPQEAFMSILKID
jgi:GTP-binding protein LepA